MSFDTVMCAIDRPEHVPETRMSTQLDHFDKENVANNSKFQHISLSIRFVRDLLEEQLRLGFVHHEQNIMSNWLRL